MTYFRSTKGKGLILLGLISALTVMGSGCKMTPATSTGTTLAGTDLAALQDQISALAAQVAANNGNVNPPVINPPVTIQPIGKFCTRFNQKEAEETGKIDRNVVVTSVNFRGNFIPNSQQDEQRTDSDGCITNLKLNAGTLNKIVTTKTLGTGSITYYINLTKDSAPSEVTVTLKDDVASKYLEELFDVSYDLANAPQSAFDALHTLVNTQCGNLDTAWKDSTLPADGTSELIDCLRNNAAVLGAFAPNGAHCYIATIPNIQFDDGGTNETGAADGVDLGDPTAGTPANFFEFNTPFDALGDDNCVLTKFNNHAITVTHKIFGTSIVGATVASTCKLIDVNNRYSGVHAEKDNVDGNTDRALYGSVLLSNASSSLESGNIDNSSDSYVEFPAVIAYFGGESTDDNEDRNLSDGDFQRYAMGAFFGANNTIIEISNMPNGDIPSAGLLGEVDSSTDYIIYEDVPLATAFVDNGHSVASADSYAAAINATDKSVVLFQECNPSEKVEFDTSVLTQGASMTVSQNITKDFNVSDKDSGTHRLFAAHMLILHLDALLPTQIADIAEAAQEKISANGIVSESIINRQDVLDSNGNISIPLVSLARMIAQTRAFCVPDVVATGNGGNKTPSDDISPVTLDTDGNITEYLAAPTAFPNCSVLGLAPYEDYKVNALGAIGEKTPRADRHGVATFDVLPALDGSFPSSVVVTSGNETFTVNVAATP